MDELPPILGQTDIVTRWGYTRQGLDQIMKREADFPAPIAAINGGRNRIWRTSDIEMFEANHPELKRAPGVREKRAPSRSSGVVRQHKRPSASPSFAQPSRYRVGYRFASKPPFDFRERMKRDGWRYLAKDDLWLALVRAPDLAGFDADFTPQGGKRIMTEAIG